MEYNSQSALYQALIPAFNVKKRLLSITENKDITNADIWKYLAMTKWKYSHNLTISEIVNDIITLDTDHLNGRE